MTGGLVARRRARGGGLDDDATLHLRNTDEPRPECPQHGLDQDTIEWLDALGLCWVRDRTEAALGHLEGDSTTSLRHRARVEISGHDRVAPDQIPPGRLTQMETETNANAPIERLPPNQRSLAGRRLGLPQLPSRAAGRTPAPAESLRGRHEEMIVMDQDDRPSMTGADLYHWVAMRRVSDGGVTKLGDRWLDRGRPVPDFVTDALNELFERALVALADSESGNMPRAALTDTGATRFEWLCQIALGMSAAQFMAFCRRFGVDESHLRDPRPVRRLSIAPVKSQLPAARSTEASYW